MFDSPMFQKMIENLSDEDREKYKRIGEYMYNSVDYEKNEILNKVKTPTEEILGYIELALQSGISIEDLEPEERQYMKDQFGNKWYEKYGFTLDDIPEEEKHQYQVTLTNNEKNNSNKKKRRPVLRKQGGRRMVVKR